MQWFLWYKIITKNELVTAFFILIHTPNCFSVAVWLWQTTFKCHLLYFIFLFSIRLWSTGTTISLCVFRKARRRIEGGLTGFKMASFIWYNCSFYSWGSFTVHSVFVIVAFVLRHCQEHNTKIGINVAFVFLFSGTYLWRPSLQSNL